MDRSPQPAHAVVEPGSDDDERDEPDGPDEPVQQELVEDAETDVAGRRDEVPRPLLERTETTTPAVIDASPVRAHDSDDNQPAAGARSPGYERDLGEVCPAISLSAPAIVRDLPLDASRARPATSARTRSATSADRHLPKEDKSVVWSNADVASRGRWQ